MRRQTIIVGSRRSEVIDLGRRGEDKATQIVFGLSTLRQLYGDGTAVLTARRAGDTAAYPVALDRDGDTATWTVSAADTAVKGDGEAEVFWYVGGTLAKSAVYETSVDRDIGDASADPPDPSETLLEQMAALAGEATASAAAAETAQAAAETAQAAAETAQAAAETAQAAAETAAGHYPYIADGVWMVWDVSAGAYVSTGVDARGQAGEPGPQGPQGPQGPAGADYVLTAADKAEIIAAVLAEYPAAEGVGF